MLMHAGIQEMQGTLSVVNASLSDKVWIIRQSGGRRLLAVFDPIESQLPAPPNFDTAIRPSFGVPRLLVWLDEGGSLTRKNAFSKFRGFLAYSEKGTADSEAFDQANKTVTSKVTFSKLNAIHPGGHVHYRPCFSEVLHY